MKIITHKVEDKRVAEVDSDQVLINNQQDALDLLGQLYYDGFDKMILKIKNITPDFFELKNGLAGEILQKFSNYRMPLTIIGDFSNYTKQAIKDFIYECNQGRQINFVSSLELALA